MQFFMERKIPQELQNCKASPCEVQDRFFLPFNFYISVFSVNTVSADSFARVLIQRLFR